MGQAKKQRSAGHDGVARRTRFGWPALLLVALLAAGIGIAWHVRGHRQSSAAAQLADLRHAGYVEAAACSECHADIAETYRHTGMARSFHRPSEAMVIEDFTRANHFFQKATGLSYTMIARDGRFYQRRSMAGFDGKETNVLEEQVDYIVGSGNHARTYLHRTAQGTLVELPINWYTGKPGSWNMSPGFDQPDQPDMHGAISGECIFCHTGYPLADDRRTRDEDEVVPATLPEGIDCQRCHGPGAAHIAAARAKASDDVIDKTIVNPGRLSRDRQLEVCTQCHLETSARHLPNSIRNYGRELDSYRPGEPLGDYKTYFERPKAANDFGFETAHAAYQLPRSVCFQKSQMTCLTCHDPHDIPRGEAATEHYVEVCQGCHTSTRNLAQDAAHEGVALKSGSNCLTCHMPKRRPEASVHVLLTDHWIQRRLPAGNLQAPMAEKPFVADHTKVDIYYPRPATRSDSDLYLAVAQVNDAGVDGTGNLRAILERENPKWPQPYVALAKAYAQAGQTDAAVKAFQEALDRRPDDQDALNGLATTLLAANRTEEAVAVLQRGATRYADDDRFLLNLGNTYLRQGRISEAEDALNKALAINPENAVAENLMGLAAVQSRETDRAEENFRESIRLDALQPEAHNNLANLLSGKHELKEAEFEFRSALRLRPHYADAHHGLGLLLVLTGRADAAGLELEEAAGEAPGNAQLWVDLGDFRSAAGRLQDAADAYRRALGINPSLPDANLALGAILMREGRAGEAVPYLISASRGDDADTARQAQGLLAQLQR